MTSWKDAAGRGESDVQSISGPQPGPGNKHGRTKRWSQPPVNNQTWGFMGLQAQATVLPVPGFTIQHCLRVRGGSSAFSPLTQTHRPADLRELIRPPGEVSVSSPVGVNSCTQPGFYVCAYYFFQRFTKNIFTPVLYSFLVHFQDILLQLFPETNKMILISETKNICYSTFSVSESQKYELSNY